MTPQQGSVSLYFTLPALHEWFPLFQRREETALSPVNPPSQTKDKQLSVSATVIHSLFKLEECEK